MWGTAPSAVRQREARALGERQDQKGNDLKGVPKKDSYQGATSVVP
jgi:hypothetical protein